MAYLMFGVLVTLQIHINESISVCTNGSCGLADMGESTAVYFRPADANDGNRAMSARRDGSGGVSWEGRIRRTCGSGWSRRAIARRFEVSLSFVVRMLQRRRASGGLKPRPHAGGAGLKLSVDDRIRLFDLVREHPGATLKDIKDLGGFDCTLDPIWRTLWQAGWACKKKNPHALERDHPKAKAPRSARIRRRIIS